MSDRWELGDPAVDAFVDANLSSFAAWDLLIFLNRNPDMCETARGLGALLGRTEHDLAAALDALTEAGTLVREVGADGSACFTLCRDQECRRIIARFVELAARREHRLEFVRRVLARSVTR